MLPWNERSVTCICVSQLVVVTAFGILNFVVVLFPAVVAVVVELIRSVQSSADAPVKGSNSAETGWPTIAVRLPPRPMVR
jgi:hypothetical protein